MWNCHTSGEISNVSGTVSPVGTGQVANDSSHIRLCSDILYMVEVKNYRRYTVHLELQEQTFILSIVFTASTRAYGNTYFFAISDHHKVRYLVYTV